MGGGVLKETLKYSPVSEYLVWGIPLTIALAAACIFWFFTYVDQETPWYQRLLRGTMGGYYLYMGGFTASAVLRGGSNLWILWVLPFYVGLAYLFCIYGHKQDVFRARRKAAPPSIVINNLVITPEPKEALWSPVPIVAYRASIHSFQNEHFNFQKAECRSRHYHSHDAPQWNCSCGYYAMKERDDVGIFTVITLLWGRVIEHEDGYRASHMMPIGYTHTPPTYGSFEPTIRFRAPSGQWTYKTNRFYGFERLPVVKGKDIDLLISTAIENFDPENPATYYGGPNGYRKTDSEN